jgi:HEAT repeat protein
MIGVVMLALILGAACESAKQGSAFEEKRAWARSSDTYERRMGAGSLVGNCCYPDGIDPSGRLNLRATQTAACGEVGRLLATEDENDVLDQLIALTNASCYRQFPVATLARLCTSSPCSMPIRRQLAAMLGRGDPDPLITEALLRLLVDSDEQIQTTVALALGDAGEADLWPAIGALSSPDPAVRRTVARGFGFATHRKVGGPLDLPAVVPALVRATNDSDADIAMKARSALQDYRAWLPLTAEQLVVHMETITQREVAIRLLGVRQFSCRTPAAGAALIKFANGTEREEVVEAKHAIELRTERCPRLVD